MLGWADLCNNVCHIRAWQGNDILQWQDIYSFQHTIKYVEIPLVIEHSPWPTNGALLNRGSAPMLRLLANAKLLFYGGYFCRSQVFKAMFENEDGLHTACLENPIILPDISPETFLCLLEFLYTNCCTLNEENVSQKIMKLDCIHIIYLIRLIAFWLNQNSLLY